jgi:hypothetical protein
MKINAARIILLAMLCAGAAASADEVLPGRTSRQGLFYAMPVYLYGTSSACGAQLGYQVGKLQFRLDASMVADKAEGELSLFANPSVGIFFTEEWESRIRTYQGAAFGVQAGLVNSFEGLSCFLNVLTGAEWFASERKAVYLEIGSCLSGPERLGSLESGTVIGGGIKCFF